MKRIEKPMGDKILNPKPHVKNSIEDEEVVKLNKEDEDADEKRKNLHDRLGNVKKNK